ncbi:MAG: glycosyltransferase [Nitrospira sp.]|jgi:glycosyltransferase involved in cell wall biosynthesis|nr:glycosyltransferase [Nitrospira sp.]MBL8054625.1 glycosyltransferase [Nitrospira sp.]
MRIKVAIVSEFPHEPGVIRGGVESVTQSLANGLGAFNELELHVVSPTSRKNAGVENRGGVMVHWLRLNKLPGFVSYWTTTRYAIHRCLRQIGPHITHFQALSGWTLGYSAPYVFTIHGIAERDILFQSGAMLGIRKQTIAAVERQGRKRSPHTILISPYVADEIGDQIGGKKWSIENPVTDDFFRVQRACKEPRILYVGRVSQRKNILALLKVFNLLLKRYPSACLILAGDADDLAYRMRCKEFIQEHKMEDHVWFVGNVDRPTLLHELSRASCLILISKQETAPMIVMEAMAAGVPVIASNICGLPYMIDDGKTGYLVDPTDEERIVHRLSLLLSNPNLAMECGRRAREVALNRFHVSVIATKTMQVYLDVLGQKRNECNGYNAYGS